MMGRFLSQDRAPLMLHLAGGIILAAAGVTFIVVVHQPLHAKQSAHHARIGELRKAISSARQAESQRETIHREILDLRQSSENVQGRIPNTADEAELLKQLATIAKQAQFTVSDYRRGEVRQDGVYTRFYIGLRGEGSFPSICQFIDQLHKLPRVNIVEQLEIRPSNGPSKYPVNLTIAFYFGGE